MSLDWKIITLVFLLTSSFCFSQKGVNYSDCGGTINIFKSHTFDLQFIGNQKKSTTFSNYPALKNITEGNQIWFSFIAPVDGTIALDLISQNMGLKLIVFDGGLEEVCSAVSKGNAEIVRMVTPSFSTHIGLNESISESFLYPVSIREGKVLYFVLIGNQNVREQVQLTFKFQANESTFSEYAVKEMYFKKDDFTPSVSIKIRDKTTGNPLVSNLILKGVKGYEGIYFASDLVFDAVRNGKLEFTCDHEGYFFKDTVVPISFNKENEILIELEPISSGKSVQLEDIEFVPGTSEITDKSIPKLVRLKDFLALNSMLNIEIQGHVFEPGGEKSLSGQKMSEARAKRVMKFLVDNGISKDRLIAVGYGATRPIYPMPRHHYEEQANRRVEIVVR